MARPALFVMLSGVKARFLLALLASAACTTPAPEPEGVEMDLVEHRDWAVIEDAAADPFAELGRPELVDCPESVGWRAIQNLDGWKLDVDLSDCNWLALEQGLLHPVRAGAPITVGFYHFDLLAPEAAEAYMAVAIGDEIIWDKSVQIPGGDEKFPAANYTEVVTAPRELVAGERVTVHVHNHGQNSYVLAYLRAPVVGGETGEG